MTDILGNRIRVGDEIAYPAIEGKLKMKRAIVSEVSEEPKFVRTANKRMLRAALSRCIVITDLVNG